MQSLVRPLAFLAASAVLSSLGFSQMTPQPVNRANWKLAERYTPEALRPFVYSMALTPGWINKTESFWYSWKDASGVKFYRVDCKGHKKAPLFDSAHMAALLSEVSKKPYDTTNLPITTVTFDEKNDSLIKFTVDAKRYEFDAVKDTLKIATEAAAATPPAGGPPGRGGGGGQGAGRGVSDFHNYSPDKKAYVYAKDHNLFYVAVADGKDSGAIQLTYDGEKNFSFGSKADQDEQRQQIQMQLTEQQRQQLNQTQQDLGLGGAQTDEPRVRANVTWSKDSKRFFVVRRDQRKVKDLYLVNSLSEPRPTLMTYKYSMPGEVNVPQTELMVFDPAKRTIHHVPAEKYKDQTLSDIHFQDTTSDALRFLRKDRLQRNEEFCEVELNTDKVTPLITESVENASLEDDPIKYVKPGGDMIWWSERSGWGHFYLYSNTGKFKNAITSGPYRASGIKDVSEEKGLFWFEAVGREPNENPYYRHTYRCKLDGTGLTLLDPGDADHSSSLSTDKKFVVDVYSRTDMEPHAVVRDEEGKPVVELEHADLARLTEAGWKMPECFKVKAADGVTDIYGNMWKPFDFDSHKKYPIIANVYPGPQTESVTTTFSAQATNQRLAQLGFIVIQIGNRGGNPARSNAYQNFGYFNLRDYGLADKKAGIEQLAAKYPWIDIDRVGIYGHSGGGFMTAAALMLPPYNTFFKVGVSSSGNHDNNVYNQNWSEQYHGLKEIAAATDTKKPEDDDMFDMGFPDSASEIAIMSQFITGNENKKFDIKVPTNAELAANLKGNLLLAHGDMDNNVHYAGTVRLMNALMRANKRFDFLLIPGKPHGYGDLQPYFTERLMEYFATYLMGDRYGYNGAELLEHK